MRLSDVNLQLKTTLLCEFPVYATKCCANNWNISLRVNGFDLGFQNHI